MRFELSRKAAEDLDQIAAYSAAQFGAERAILYLDAMEQAFRRLLDHPAIGSGRPELGPAIRSYPAGEHRIFYAVRDDTVFVIRLLHKAMDVDRHV